MINSFFNLTTYLPSFYEKTIKFNVSNFVFNMKKAFKIFILFSKLKYT